MGTGYTRKDTVNNIADGNIINASDLDLEFDGVQAAFDAATGHTHDGTTAEGAPIEVTGPAQEYVSTNTELRPKANNTYDLGSASNQWKDLYVDGTANLDTVDIDAGNIDGTVIGAATPAAGTFTTATATTGNITTVNATTVDTTNIEVTNLKAKDGTAAGSIADSTGVVTLASSVLTATDINGGTIDGTTIGGASAAAGTFTNVTATGTVNLSGATVSNGGTVTTVDINGGTIDGATIATSDITVGTGKTLNVSSGTLTLANDQISGDKVEGGTINAITINTLGSTTGNITTVNATTVDSTNVEVTNIKAKDGTASATIADSTGVMTIASSVLTTTDINGGTIDGTVIGGSTPAAISGTTITGTGLTIDAATDPTIRLFNTGTVTSGEILGTLEFYQEDGSAPGAGVVASIEARNTDASSGAGSLAFTAGFSDSNNDRMLINSNGDISFYEDTGTTPKFFWDASAEALGIGTSSPAANLDVTTAGATNTSKIKITTNPGGSPESTLELFTSGPSLDASERAVINAKSDGNAIIAFQVNDVERMRINDSGNVGIGTSSPVANNAGAKTLQIDGAANGVDIRLTNTGTGSTASNGSAVVLAGADFYLWNYENAFTAFGTNNTERMRIDASGNLLVNCTTTGAAVDGLRLTVNNVAQFSRSNADVLSCNRSGTDGAVAIWYKGGTAVGSVSVTGSSTAYNTSSDYRLKEDVQPMVGASDRLMALKPVNFAWKVDGSRVDGFLAHEAQEVVPEAVTGEKDAVDKDGKPEYQGIDQSKLLPVVVAALQDSIKRIAALEAELLALKGSANA